LLRRRFINETAAFCYAKNKFKCVAPAARGGNLAACAKTSCALSFAFLARLSA